jgi:transcriptional regulator with XRE-family HTH domain
MAKDVLFSEWLNEQMQREQLTQAQLARAAGIGATTVNKMLNSKSKRPSADSCLGIAKALKIRPETVFRAAKILPTEPEFKGMDEHNMLLAQLSDRDREVLLAFERVFLEFKNKGSAAIK